MPQELPQHLAIIMDGNGRWAQQRGLLRSEGHRAGVLAARAVITECRTLGLPYLTLYTFSRENWNRPQEEVAMLFRLLAEFLGEEVPSMVRQGIRLHVLGHVDGLPLTTRTALRHAMQRTLPPDGAAPLMTLNLALNYGGRDEILHAARALVADGLRPNEVTEDAFRQRLYTAGQPDPDLIIRTSGEMRISNYLLFQCAYSEFSFSPILWPDFTPEVLRAALNDYAGRHRRFGKTQEQCP